MESEKIQSLLASLDPDYRLFVESDFIETTASEFGSISNFTPRQQEILENALFFYLLTILDEESVVLFISRNCDLPVEETKLLWLGIEKVIPTEVLAMLRNSREQAISASEEAAQLLEEIKQTETDLASLHSVRTMPQDMAAIRPGSDVVYQSSQAEILQQPKPPFVVPETPRWESDTKQ